MKPYRPQPAPWQPILDQVSSRTKKQPDCYGHHRPNAILCSKCAWADDCKALADGSTSNSQQGTPNEQGTKTTTDRRPETGDGRS